MGRNSNPALISATHHHIRGIPQLLPQERARLAIYSLPRATMAGAGEGDRKPVCHFPNLDPFQSLSVSLSFSLPPWVRRLGSHTVILMCSCGGMQRLYGDAEVSNPILFHARPALYPLCNRSSPPALLAHVSVGHLAASLPRYQQEKMSHYVLEVTLHVHF